MVNLSKGQKIDLTKKDGSKLVHVLVGLGWEEAQAAPPQEKKKGILGMLSKNRSGSSGPVQPIDIDASVFLTASGKVADKNDVIYFGRKTHSSGAVVHKGDNLVGGKMGGLEDSEQIAVDLGRIPRDIDGAAFVVNIYDCVHRGQDFGMVRNAYIRIIDQDTREELIRYSLTDEYAGYTAIKVGTANRTADGWEFQAVGIGSHASGINEMLKEY